MKWHNFPWGGTRRFCSCLWCFCGGVWLYIIGVAKVRKEGSGNHLGGHFSFLCQGANSSVNSAHHGKANCWNVGVDCFSASFAWVEGVFKVRIAQFNISLRLSASAFPLPSCFPWWNLLAAEQIWRLAGSRRNQATAASVEAWQVNVASRVSKSLLNKELLVLGPVWLSGCDLKTSRYWFWSWRSLPGN